MSGPAIVSGIVQSCRVKQAAESWLDRELQALLDNFWFTAHPQRLKAEEDVVLLCLGLPESDELCFQCFSPCEGELLISICISCTVVIIIIA